MKKNRLIGSLTFSVWFLFSSLAGALEEDRSIYLFAGRFTRGTMGESINLTGVEYDNYSLLAFAYGIDLAPLTRNLVAGWETGLAGRFGKSVSGELWGGLYLRHRALGVSQNILVKPFLSFGLSLVDRSVGMEKKHELRRNGDARLLYYLGPELALSLADQPGWELVYRMHHRSGGSQTLGNLKEGHNANTIGIRHRF